MTPTLAFSTDDSLRALAILADAAAKSLVILAAAAAVTVALRRGSAALRHMVWTLAVAALALVPVLSAAMPAWRVPVLPAAHEVAAVRPPVRGANYSEARPVYSPGANYSEAPPVSSPEVGGAAVPPLPTYSPRTADTTPVHWSAWVLVAWAAGSVIMVALLLIGTVGARHARRQARRVTGERWLRLLEDLRTSLGVRRTVALMESRGSLIPMVCGILQPTILLPAEAESWSAERRSVVLLHELAHIRRADCLTQAAARLVRALYWFNPLIWLAGRMLRIERERACDDMVLAAGHKASAYASHLLEIVSTLRSARCPSLAAVAMARRSQFEGRMLAILDPRRSRRRLTRLGLAAAALLVVGIVLPLSMFHATAADKVEAEKTDNPAAPTATGENPAAARTELLRQALAPAMPDSAKVAEALADVGYLRVYFFKGPFFRAPEPAAVPPGSWVSDRTESSHSLMTEVVLNRPAGGPAPKETVEKLLEWRKLGFEAASVEIFLAPSEAVAKRRDALLAEADRAIRKNLLTLAEKFPVLRQTGSIERGYAPLAEALKNASDPDSLSIHASRPEPSLSEYRGAEPKESQYAFSVHLKPLYLDGPSDQLAQQGSPLWPDQASHLCLMGEAQCSAGDPKLKVSLQKLLDDALAPLLALDREAAQPAAGAPAAPAALPGSAMADPRSILAARRSNFWCGVAEATEEPRAEHLEDGLRVVAAQPFKVIETISGDGFGRPETLAITYSYQSPHERPPAKGEKVIWTVAYGIHPGGNDSGSYWGLKAWPDTKESRAAIAAAAAPAGEAPAKAQPEAASRPLPGSRVALTAAQKTPQSFLASCVATKEASVMYDEAGVGMAMQKFKILATPEGDTGIAGRGAEVLVYYTVYTIGTGGERPIKKGERIIWFATVQPPAGGGQGVMWLGIKAFLDTRDNRKLVGGWVVPAEAAEAPAGEAVRGVRLRLVAARPQWKADETPTLEAALLNGNKQGLECYSITAWSVEVDGQEYRFKGLGGDARIALPPLPEVRSQTITLDDDWRIGKDPAVLTPGKHTVRVSTSVGFGDTPRGTPKPQVTSNAVEIEVLAADAKPPAPEPAPKTAAGQALQKKLAADIGQVDYSLQFFDEKGDNVYGPRRSLSLRGSNHRPPDRWFDSDIYEAQARHILAILAETGILDRMAAGAPAPRPGRLPGALFCISVAGRAEASVDLTGDGDAAVAALLRAIHPGLRGLAGYCVDVTLKQLDPPAPADGNRRP